MRASTVQRRSFRQRRNRHKRKFFLRPQSPKLFCQRRPAFRPLKAGCKIPAQFLRSKIYLRLPRSLFRDELKFLQ